MRKLTVYQDDREVVLKFEHSLLSLSKWEAKHKKAFLHANLTSADLLDYFQQMLLSPEDAEDLVFALEPKQLKELKDYVDSNQSASTVPSEPAPKHNPEVTTSELIYYWLVGLQIPFHPVETWHLSRLMMLIQITSFKQKPAKKEKPGDTMARYAAINAANKKRLGTTG